MKKSKSIKFIAMAFFASTMLFPSDSIYANDDDMSELDSDEEIVSNEDEKPVQKNEGDWFEYIMNKSNNEPFNPYITSKDPFKALVEKKIPVQPKRIKQEVKVKQNDEVKKEKLPPVKPIEIKVSGIVGNDDQRLAVINFENNEYTVAKDQNIDGKFKVIDIQNDRITIYSNKEQKRRSFKIDKDDK